MANTTIPARIIEVICPECAAVLPIPVAVHIGAITEDGDLPVEAVPDLTDVWAHAWTHEAQ